MSKRELMAFRHPVKKDKYVLLRANKLTDMLSKEEKIVIKNQEMAEEILRDSYNTLVVINKNILHILTK